MSTSVGSVTTGFFPTAQNGFSTTLASTISSGAATVPLNSVAGYTNGAYAVFVIEPTSATAKQTFTGVIDTSGVQVTSVVWTAGTNQTHTGGVSVVDYTTATHMDLMSKGIKVSHNDDGTMISNLPLTTPKITTSIKDSSGNTIIPFTGSSSTTSIKLTTTAVGPTYVESGCVWTGDSYGSTRAASMTAGVVYINGVRLTVAVVTARTFTASKDTYVDLTDAGNGTATIAYSESTNNAASQSLAANGLRIAIIVTAAGSIAAAASINQGSPAATTPTVSTNILTVCDSLGNVIYPTSGQTLIGYRYSTANSGSQASGYVVPGLSMPIIVPVGRKIKLYAKLSLGQATSTTSATVTTTIRESAAAIIAGDGQVQGANGFSNAGDAIACNIIAPSTGSHTYDVTASIGTGNVVVNGGTTKSSLIWAELV